jgi:hypothetical protein
LRASSLSNKKIIELLNAYFIPVYVDGTYLQNNPESAAKELSAYRELFAELHRANQERRQASQEQFSVGTVHAYVFAPEGKVLDSRHVAHAGPESVIEMLETAIKKTDVPAGEAIIAPASQSPRPDAAADALVLHLTARYLVPRDSQEARKDAAGELVPRDASQLGGERSGGWHALPSEDWYVLTRAEWTELLPQRKVNVGDSWQVDDKTADTLLTRFYPTTELNDLNKNRIDERSLKLTVLSIDKDQVRARIDGNLEMKHPFYPGRDDNNFVKAKLVGLLDFDASKPLIHSLQIVTEHATYGGDDNRLQPFGVALRNVD